MLALLSMLKSKTLTITICGAQLGPSIEVEKVDEQKLLNGKEEPKGKKHEDGNTQFAKENGCQWLFMLQGWKLDVTGEKKHKETKGLGGLSCWLGSFEQRHVLTAAAVVGAVATIAVA